MKHSSLPCNVDVTVDVAVVVAVDEPVVVAELDTVEDAVDVAVGTSVETVDVADVVSVVDTVEVAVLDTVVVALVWAQLRYSPLWNRVKARLSTAVLALHSAPLPPVSLRKPSALHSSVAWLLLPPGITSMRMSLSAPLAASHSGRSDARRSSVAPDCVILTSVHTSMVKDVGAGVLRTSSIV